MSLCGLDHFESKVQTLRRLHSRLQQNVDFSWTFIPFFVSKNLLLVLSNACQPVKSILISLFQCQAQLHTIRINCYWLHLEFNYPHSSTHLLSTSLLLVHFLSCTISLFFHTQSWLTDLRYCRFSLLCNDSWNLCAMFFLISLMSSLICILLCTVDDTCNKRTLAVCAYLLHCHHYHNSFLDQKVFQNF